MKAAEVEEQVRDTALWLLHGLEKVLEPVNFYYHLKTDCEATNEHIQQVKHAFRKVSFRVFMANLKYRASLGELLRGVKAIYHQQKRYPGETTL